MTIVATPEDVARFLSYVEVLPSGCWFWTGARSRGSGNRKWYASFRLGARVVRGHRFSCEVLADRPCPPGHDRSHTCHFSLCVCPDHLEVLPREHNQSAMRERKSSTGPVYIFAGQEYSVICGRLVPTRDRGEGCMARKPTKRYTPIEMSVEDAISAGYGVAEELHGEIDEVVSNMEEKLSHTSRYQTLEQTRDTLAGVKDNQPEWPSELDGVDIVASYTEDRRKGLSRAQRLSNGEAAIGAAADALRSWADETEGKIADGEPGEGDDNSELEEKIQAARDLADELESHAGDLSGCEFPGMYG